MKIIKGRSHVTHTEYRRFYEYDDMPNAGFSFPSDPQGNVDVASLPDVAKGSYAACLTGVVRTVDGPKKVIDRGVEAFTHSYHEPAIGLCSCGREVILDGFTCPCDCGADYNSAGQRLAPRSQWGEETGESLSDILNIR